jgi:hypothetical protein
MSSPSSPLNAKNPYPDFTNKGPQPAKGTFGEQVGSSLRDKAEEFKGTAEEKARSLTDKAKGAAGAVGDKIEEGMSAVGGGMKSLADTVREKGPHEGKLASATSSVAESLESGGRYLQEQGLSGMAADLTDVVRNHPIPALLIAIGLGFMIARATRS